jgi:hypothetical protein
VTRDGASDQSLGLMNSSGLQGTSSAGKALEEVGEIGPFGPGYGNGKANKQTIRVVLSSGLCPIQSQFKGNGAKRKVNVPERRLNGDRYVLFRSGGRSKDQGRERDRFRSAFVCAHSVTVLDPPIT